eukprot:148789-Rhodomonas_salina.1
MSPCPARSFPPSPPLQITLSRTLGPLAVGLMPISHSLQQHRTMMTQQQVALPIVLSILIARCAAEVFDHVQPGSRGLDELPPHGEAGTAWLGAEAKWQEKLRKEAAAASREAKRALGEDE